jgi:hypothetical protein
MLFHFLPETDKPAREQCEIGIIHETGNDPHRLIIKVYQVDENGLTKLANPQDVGMTANPRIFDQTMLKNLASFHLFLGQDPNLPPQTGSVIREQSFDSVLQIDGIDFYDQPLDLIWAKMTPFFVTTGSFSGVNSTAHAEFCRISEAVLQLIEGSLSEPSNWSTLVADDKYALKSFARKMRAEIEISEDKYLILNAKSQSSMFETVFKLSKPESDLKRYVLEIDNLDEVEEKHSPEFIVSNCANCRYLCEAIDFKDKSQNAEKKIFALSYNFDFTIDTDNGLGEDTERCDTACCIAAEVG